MYYIEIKTGIEWQLMNSNDTKVNLRRSTGGSYIYRSTWRKTFHKRFKYNSTRTP